MFRSRIASSPVNPATVAFSARSASWNSAMSWSRAVSRSVLRR